MTTNTTRTLGINGLGRIGKLTVWYHLAQDVFDRIVVNTGRPVGRSLDDLVHLITHDSTYGRMEQFLFGQTRRVEARILDEEECRIKILDKEVVFLTRSRNPREIAWREQGVDLVVDATGVFMDPAAPEDSPRGALRGHLEAGAARVIVSGPFKSSAKMWPEDAVMLIQGINHTSFDPGRHRLISAASCTTTALSHMMKPLLEQAETSHILTASMSTLHAATNNQSALDRCPAAESKDLRRNRSIFNNMIITSTGSARALEHVLPEIRSVGFMADAVRIPTNTASLVNLNLTFAHSARCAPGAAQESTIPGAVSAHSTPGAAQESTGITRDSLNGIYRVAAAGAQAGLLSYSDNQNVSADIIGKPAAVTIEGCETHTRTGFIELPREVLAAAGVPANGLPAAQHLRVPVTHAKIFGWYDNEYGSFVRCLGQLTEHINRSRA
jgi:glyceraldehyde 3-phosphate dehydrogenase